MAGYLRGLRLCMLVREAFFNGAIVVDVEEQLSVGCTVLPGGQ